MKKVIFFVSALDVGGIENYLLRFITYANDRLDSTVLCKSGRRGTLDSEYTKQNANVVLFKLGYFSFFDYWKLYKYLKEEKFDAVCDFTGDFSGIVLLISKLAGVSKRLAFYRNSLYKFNPSILKNLYAKFMNILTKRYATKILSNSQAALNYFHTQWEKQEDFYEVIRNGIPEFEKISIQKRELIRSNLKLPKNAFLIGHVGRYNPQKNHMHILKVASNLVKEYDNVYFFLCGREVKDNLFLKVKELDLEKNVILDNSRSDIWDLLQCFDAFYFPSLVEGQPNALLESMSVGLPFVASNIDSIKETVPKEYYNYLTSPNDMENTVALFKIFIKDNSKFSSKELAKWTQDHYSAEKLFNQFFMNL